MVKSLNILMICHHRRHKSYGRSHAMAKNLVQTEHKTTLVVIAKHRRFGVEETEWDGARVIETPDLLWGRLWFGWDPWGMLNRIIFLSREKEPSDILFVSKAPLSTCVKIVSLLSNKIAASKVEEKRKIFFHGSLDVTFHLSKPFLTSY